MSTDLSDEAAYALEWTIGTVLRDGDTLLAVYAVDEGIGVAASETLGAPTTLPGDKNQTTLRGLCRTMMACQQVLPVLRHYQTLLWRPRRT